MNSWVPVKQRGKFCQWLTVVLVGALMVGANLGVVNQLTRNSRQYSLVRKGWQHPSSGVHTRLSAGGCVDTNHLRHAASTAAHVSYNMSCQDGAADPHSTQLLGPTTDKPMMPQPPFAPGCFPSPQVQSMDLVGCPDLHCSLGASCTVDNKSCCAYFNIRVLDFLDRFLTAHCLQDEYMLVYGTMLGSVREGSILPHTEDVDIGLTPLAIQFLELNSTKQLLWQHGYTFWYHYLRGVWKLRPHTGHPSQHFRAAMTDKYADVAQYESVTRMPKRALVDAWLMWPVSGSMPNCSVPAFGKPDLAAVLQTPWDQDSLNPSASLDFCSGAKRMAKHHDSTDHAPALLKQRAAPTVQRYCVSESDRPHLLRHGSRTGWVADRAFPMPDNYAEIMAATYGSHWKTPKRGYHGQSVSLNRPSELQVKRALLEKLSVTAWGDMPWKERKRKCKLPARTAEWQSTA